MNFLLLLGSLIAEYSDFATYVRAYREVIK